MYYIKCYKKFSIFNIKKRKRALFGYNEMTFKIAKKRKLFLQQRFIHIVSHMSLYTKKRSFSWIPFIGMRQILWIWILLFLFRTLLRLHHPNFLGNCKMQKIINVSVIITGDYKRLGESFVIYHRCQGGKKEKWHFIHARSCW